MWQTTRRGFIALLALGFHLAAVAQGGLCMGGALPHPACLSAAELGSLPRQAAGVSFLTSKGAQSHRWSGPSVWGLLQSAGIDDGSGLDRFVLAIGEDGYAAVFSIGELHPQAGALPSIVAIDGDGPPARRLTAPRDARGGRYVFMLARIEVRAAPRSSAKDDLGASARRGLSILRDGVATRHLDAAELMRLSSAATVAPSGSAGLDLWQLVQTSGVAPLDPADSLRSYLIATGAGGRRVVLAAAEIDPAFAGRAARISVGTNGSLQLTVPEDLTRVRWTEGLHSLDVIRWQGP